MADMSTADINDLPDSDFAYIEPGGEKDDEGKTKPRSLRHYPIQDAAHVRNALARAQQAISAGGDAATIARHALPRIEAKAKALGIGDGEKSVVLMPGAKAIIDDAGYVDGWLAPYGGPVKGDLDLQGEKFTPATDFALNYYKTYPILVDHGMDPDIEAEKVGDIDIKDVRDRGVWVQGQLDRQNKYFEMLRELQAKGQLFWSSGALAHLVRKDRESGEIRRWPIGEATLTMTPANPFAVASVKSIYLPDPIEDPAAPRTFSLGAIKVGARNSASDQALIQTIHDHAMALGATCSGDDADAGKALATPPASDLASAGKEVATVQVVDLEQVASRLMSLIESTAADGVKPFFG